MRFFFIASITFLALTLTIPGGSNAFTGQPPTAAHTLLHQTEFEAWQQAMDMSANWSKRDMLADFDVTFYDLNVRIHVDSPYIQGSVTCHFRATTDNLSEIKLNLQQSLTVNSISGNANAYLFADDTLTIFLENTLNTGDSSAVIISYEGIPPLANDIKGLKYETHGEAEPIIASLTTPYLAHYWWPCKDGPGDKPDSIHVNLTIPDMTVNGLPLIAVSNGVLTDITTEAGWRTFHWRHRYPIVPYYVMAAVSNYVHFQQMYSGANGETFPLDYYVFADHLTDAQAGVADLPQAMDLFSFYFGDYPFAQEKYGMTQLGFYGAIENQTNAIMNNMGPDWFWVSVHELAHMWFGDMITCADWHHGWLNEGFATYAEALWVEDSDGQTSYRQYMNQIAYFDAGTVYLSDTSDPFEIFVGIIYYKGAWVLHMLRGVLGDDTFFEVLHDYSASPDVRYGHATTADFQAICESVSGLDLDSFFEQWIYDEYYPIYASSYSQHPETHNLTLTIQQTQDDPGWRPLFEMPIDVRFEFADGSDTLLTVWNDQTNQTFFFDLDQAVNMVALDPDDWILCEKGATVAIDEPADDALIGYLPVNYPNPFREQTAIRFHTAKTAPISLHIYDVTGRLVRSLANGQTVSDGLHEITWDGRDESGHECAAGVYIFQLIRNDRQTKRTMVLMK